ncbi:transporter [Tsukamurella pseudospumae]|uniref:Transporter n=1 Tax=Tsukamurella pseudospumae TaxID=239498 RepID=A0A138A7R2_9ACTN|nr:transporter [Tsukamurella pseudospumae]KXP06509.1 transporter [Tsukamurella pseudospumae]
MREILFMIAAVWVIVASFVYGVKFLRKHHNYLLGLEWIVMGISCTNFLVFAAIKGGHDGLQYHIALFIDAFSRSIGMTLILVLGLMQVTHRYKPTRAVEIGAFALAGVVGFLLIGYQDFPSPFAVAAAIFFIVAFLLTGIYLVYFTKRLWEIGERRHAVWTGIATFLGLVVTAIYDTGAGSAALGHFAHIPGDDADHTLFYIFALATWGLMMVAYYRAYDAFDAHNKRADAATGRLTNGVHA